MYSSVAALHIALDTRLQQISSNRKQAIMPEQYDIALNDAIHAVLTERLSAKLNARREGYEDSITAYDNLKSLKRTCKPTLYFDDTVNKWYFELPSNYYMFDALQAEVYFDRRQIAFRTKSVNTKRVHTFRFSPLANGYAFKKDDLRYKLTNSSNNLVSLQTDDIYLTGASNKSSFYYFNLVCDWFKAKYGVDCYFENYLGNYTNNSLIFVTHGTVINNPTDINIGGIGNTPAGITVTLETPSVKVLDVSDSLSVNMGPRKVDLVSTLDDTNEFNDFYLHYNKHLNPKCIMSENKVYLTSDPTFYYNNPIFNYIKRPRPLDSRINQMTDISVTEDILDVATNHLAAMLGLGNPYGERSSKQQSQQQNQN